MKGVQIRNPLDFELAEDVIGGKVKQTVVLGHVGDHLQVLENLAVGLVDPTKKKSYYK